jgi:multiple sugar transport system substrate-binding protein
LVKIVLTKWESNEIEKECIYMKKFWSNFLVVALFVSLCVTSGFCATKKPELTVWMVKTFSPEANDMMAQRAKEFAEKNNVNLNYVQMAIQDFYPKWTAAIESRQTPDVSYLTYASVGEFYARGVLMDLTALGKKIEKEQGALFSRVKAPITFKGKQYGIPLYFSSQVLYYRKDLLKAAGYDNPPKTWDEFRKIAKATTNPGKGIYGAGIGYGTGNTDCECLSRTIIASFGGSETNKAGTKVTINSPATLKAAKYITDIFTVDKSTPPSALGWDDGGNNKAYMSGQVAMIFNTGSVLTALKNNNPELYAKTGIAINPSGPKGCFPILTLSNFGIFKNTKQPQLAQEFIKYCMAKDWYGKWIEKAAPNLAPVYQSLANDPVWQEPMNKPFIEQAKYFICWGYKGPYTPAAGRVLNSHYYNDAFQRIIVERWAPKKAIKELQTNVEKTYKK